MTYGISYRVCSTQKTAVSIYCRYSLTLSIEKKKKLWGNAPVSPSPPLGAWLVGVCGHPLRLPTATYHPLSVSIEWGCHLSFLGLGQMHIFVRMRRFLLIFDRI